MSKVESWGDWTMAWNRTVTATAFAFPHRLAELLTHGENIGRLFSGMATPFHNVVISYDKAVRKRVGSTRCYELTDVTAFADLYKSHVDPTGSAVALTASGSSQHTVAGPQRCNQQRVSKSRVEPCNNWNENRCKWSAEECHRLHICSKCHKAGHTAKTCSTSNSSN